MQGVNSLVLFATVFPSGSWSVVPAMHSACCVDCGYSKAQWLDNLSCVYGGVVDVKTPVLVAPDVRHSGGRAQSQVHADL
jgi:hypothetical protein